MRDASDTRNQSVGGTAMFHGDPNKPRYQIDEGDTVTRFVPREVRLTLPDHTVRVFRPGLQEIPRELADHPWLRDNGVVEYDKGRPLPPMMMTAAPGSQAHAASLHSSGVYDATRVPNPRVEDHHVAAAERVAEAAVENARLARENAESAERVAAGAARMAQEARARHAAQRSEPRQPPADENLGTGVDEQRLSEENETRAARADKLSARKRKEYDALDNDEARDAYLADAGV